MAFKITYYDGDAETVDAEHYQDEGPWITFTRTSVDGMTMETHQVLRVRGDDVKRIDQE